MIIEVYTIFYWIIFGIIFISLFFDQMDSLGAPGFCLTIGLSLGFSIGLTSLFYFLFSIIFNLNGALYILSEIGMLVISALLLLKYTNFKFIIKNIKFKTEAFKLKSIGLIDIVCWLCLIGALLIFLFELFQNPYGRWDASAMWNLKAKLLVKGNGWINVFSNEISHPDYPILVPLAVSRIWTYKGFYSLIDPAMVAFVFFSSIIFVVYGAISIIKSSYHGKLAVILLVSTPFFVIDSAGLCADIPLAFYSIVFCILYTLAQEFESKKLLIISGISLGLSTWTKNEGLLFSLIALSIHFFGSIYRLGFSNWLKEFYRICLGFVPLLFTMLWLKYLYAPPNDILASLNQHTILENIFDINRYAIILENFTRELVYVGDWIIQIPIVLIFFVIYTGPNKKRNYVSLILLSILITMLMAYFMTYLLTPHDLTWHIANSMNRLIIQLWPLFIFVYFYYIDIPYKRAVLN